MIRNSSRRLSAGKLLVFLALACGGSKASVVFDLSPSVTAVSPGSTVTVDGIISGLGNPPSIGSFDVSVGFDPGLLVLSSVDFGPLLGDPNAFEALTDVRYLDGIVNPAEVSLLSNDQLDALQGPSFSLFTLTFTAQKNGLVKFQYLGGPIDDGNGVLLVGAKAVPEPSTFSLVALAAGLLLLVKRRAGKAAGILPVLVAFAMTSLRAETHLSITATTPHLATGTDPSRVLVQAVDDLGRPIINADIAIEVRTTGVVNQLEDYGVRLSADNGGTGAYSASFSSTVPGTVVVTAMDRISNALASTSVDFTIPAIASSMAAVSSAVAAHAVFSRLAEAAPADPKENCGLFFDDLDKLTGNYLVRAIDDEKDAAKKKALEDLRDASNAVGQVLQMQIDIETRLSKGEQVPAQVMQAYLKAAQNAKANFQTLSTAQESLLKKYFGNPIDFGKFQSCVELFNNFKLVNNFDAAVKDIQKYQEALDKIENEPNPAKQAQMVKALGRVVVRGPNSSLSHIHWAKFAKISIDLGVDKALWQNLIPILAKGTQITTEVLTKKNPKKDEVNGPLSDARIAQIRNIFDPLRPAAGDTDAQKDDKVKQVESKLLPLLKDINDPNKTIGQLPGNDADRVLTATITQSACVGGAPNLTGMFGAFALLQGAGGVFGYGLANNGGTYIALDDTPTTSSLVLFSLSGFGFSPGFGSAVSAFQGISSGDSMTGSFQGAVLGLAAGTDTLCTYSGQFRIDPRSACDLNGDRVVDLTDILPIVEARNTLAFGGDPRDADGDGVITTNDARFCAVRCSKPLCAR